MASANSLTLAVSGWVPAHEWASSADGVRLRYLRETAADLQAAKRRQVLAGTGANGRRLKARKRARADGADGEALDPHRELSRSYKWIRATVGLKAGTVTVHWSHGWSTILGYHRAGAGRLPVRNIIEFPAVMIHQAKLRAAERWKAILRGVPSSSAASIRPAVAAPGPSAARPVNIPLGTFRSTAEALAYSRAVAAGRNLGPNRGGVVRTSRRSFLPPTKQRAR